MDINPTPATMRAAREHAEILASDIVTALEQDYVHSETYKYIIDRIAAALAEAERGALTRAAEVARDYWKSNEPTPKGTTWVGDEIAVLIERLKG